MNLKAQEVAYTAVPKDNKNEKLKFAKVKTTINQQ